jgi:hypothetical protein
MSDPKADAQARLRMKASTIEGGQVYRHYKGGVYVVLTLAVEEATLEPVVVYRSCERGTVWTRLLGDFTFRFPDGAYRFERIA